MTQNTKLLQHASCPTENAFRTKHGEVYFNLSALAEGLYRMPLSAFVHHVNNNKNDFSVWLTEVFKQEKLANEIKLLQNPIAIAKIISNQIEVKK